MEILTFLYFKLFIIIKVIMLFSGIYLCLKAKKIKKYKLRNFFSIYIGIIFGSLGGFLLTKSAYAMLIGAVVGIGVFYWTDKIFKNDGMFVTAFIASTDSIYIVVMGIIYFILRRKEKNINISDDELNIIMQYFHSEDYVVWDMVLLISVIIGLIVAIALSLTIKNRDVLTAMAIFIGVIQIFGTLFSYTFYFMNKVYNWEIMYIPLLNVHYEYNGIYLILPIILLTTSFYWIQKERK